MNVLHLLLIQALFACGCADRLILPPVPYPSPNDG